MLLITAVVRPEKTYSVLGALAEAGFYGMSRWDVVGRGK
ncbi:MAG: P-II family nitrogen regulator, partial [Gemmiger sp.]